MSTKRKSHIEAQFAELLDQLNRTRRDIAAGDLTAKQMRERLKNQREKLKDIEAAMKRPH